MYDLAYDNRIEKDLRAVPHAFRRVILERVERLATEPRRHHVEMMSDMDGYRLRVGEYRVLFTIDDHRKLVTVYRIRHRRDAYRW